MLTFIPSDLLVLQKIEPFGIDGDGTLPGLCLYFSFVVLSWKLFVYPHEQRSYSSYEASD